MLKKISISIMLVVFAFAATAMAADDLAAKIKLYKTKVDAAAKIVETKGIDDAEKLLTDAKGEHFFDNGQGYTFVLDTTGFMLIHPTLKGKKVLELKDVTGYPIIKSLIEMAVKNGSGWIEYKWAKPGQVLSSPKVTYTKLVVKDGKKFVCGAGVYDITMADIYKVYPEEAKKTIDVK